MTGRALLLLGAGFTIWAVAFVALYAMLSVGCEFGWHMVELGGGMTLQRAQLVVIFLLHLAAAILLVVVLRRNGRETFLHRASHWAALAAAFSIVFSFAPVFALSTCH